MGGAIAMRQSHDFFCREIASLHSHKHPEIHVGYFVILIQSVSLSTVPSGRTFP
jgi:hypothetical protein